MLRFIIAYLVALIVTLLTTPIAIWLAPRVGAMDKPNERKVHTGSTPRIGGVAIFCGFLVAALIGSEWTKQLFGLLISCGIVVLVGFVDDTKGITPKVKILGQLLAAIIFVVMVGYIKYLTNPIGGDMIFLDYWGIPLTILWLVGISNAINLIDGLDGLAAGVSGIAAVTLATVSFSRGYTGVSVLAICLAMSLLGFLKYNFHPAKIFMGDSGALFLGFLLAALSIMGFTKGATVISLLIPLLILGIPIFDTFFAIIRRSLNHKPILAADKGHLHHRLLAMGLSHKQTVLIIYGITLFMGVSAISLTVLTNAQAVVILIIFAFVTLLGANKLGVLKKSKKKPETNKTPSNVGRNQKWKGVDQ